MVAVSGRVRRIRRVRRSDGFTLLEVMLALTLLGIGLLSLAAMQLIALDYGSRGRHQTQAAAVAEAQMEGLMRRRWTNLAPTGGWTAPITQDNVMQGGVEQSYDVSWRIADADAGRTRTIDVLVEWDEPSRPNRRYALSSMRFNHEGL